MQARAAEPFGEPAEVVIGGQSTTLPPTYLVPIDVASSAALHFLETQEPAPGVIWDQM